ncbi:uncharacterized protein [Temnothorax nylanderi]|uniref:uncharacterized protein n=1 Tax=Temnothorax nylanderi TaxID=102681 RepID=UPI003A894567
MAKIEKKFTMQRMETSVSASGQDKTNESSQRQPGAFETFNVHENKQQEDCLGADVPDIIPLTSNSSIPTHSREISNQELNEVERLKKELKEANIKLNLAQKIILKSNRSVNVLKKHIKRLTQMKNNSKTQNYLRLESSLKQLFNDDQIRALMRSSSRGHMWSNDTIKKALRLKYACGSSGYKELLKQKHPLPCERTLQRKLESIQFQEGICDDIFKLLEDKITQFKDVRERDCLLVLDEMSIVPGQQFDPSTQSYYGTASFCTRKESIIELFQEMKVGNGTQFKPVQRGVIITTKSIIELSTYLINEKDYQFVLAGHSQLGYTGLVGTDLLIRVSNSIFKLINQ